MQQILLRVALLLEKPPGRLSDEDEGGHEEDPPDPIGDLQNRSWFRIGRGDGQEEEEAECEKEGSCDWKKHFIFKLNLFQLFGEDWYQI